MYLTDEQLEKTTGKKRPTAQAKVLNRMGIHHKTRPDGKVLVLAAHVDKVLGGVESAQAAELFEIDWS